MCQVQTDLSCQFCPQERATDVAADAKLTKATHDEIGQLKDSDVGITDHSAAAPPSDILPQTLLTNDPTHLAQPSQPLLATAGIVTSVSPVRTHGLLTPGVSPAAASSPNSPRLAEISGDDVGQPEYMSILNSEH